MSKYFFSHSFNIIGYIQSYTDKTSVEEISCSERENIKRAAFLVKNVRKHSRSDIALWFGVYLFTQCSLGPSNYGNFLAPGRE